MFITNESREKTIKKLLKGRKELYVVDVDLVDNKTGENIKQWYIYEDLDHARSYLSLVENHCITRDKLGRCNLMELSKGLSGDVNYLRFRYIDNVGNDISEMFTITKIERAT